MKELKRMSKEKKVELESPPKPKEEFINETIVQIWNGAILPNMKPTIIGGELIGAKDLFKVDKILQVGKLYLDTCYQQGYNQAVYDNKKLLKEKTDGELRESSGKDKPNEPRGSVKENKRNPTRKNATSEEKTSNTEGE